MGNGYRRVKPNRASEESAASAAAGACDHRNFVAKLLTQISLRPRWVRGAAAEEALARNSSVAVGVAVGVSALGLSQARDENVTSVSVADWSGAAAASADALVVAMESGRSVEHTNCRCCTN